MSQNNIMDKLRSFFGFRIEPPRNDFRNPIWGSDDDDDGDELYSRQQFDTLNDPQELHREFVLQMQDMFRTFGSMFSEMGSFFSEDNFHSMGTMTDTPEIEGEPENFDSNRIRDYYLKPGYYEQTGHPKEDVDLDGKISSNDISVMLKLKDGRREEHMPPTPFQGELVPGRSFFKTIITTSVTKPDGTIETRRIVKNGNEIVEETTTCTEPPHSPYNPNIGPIDASNLLSHLSSFFRNFH